jgi:phosphomannomutase
MLAIDEKLYICPGEAHPITRAVHLSRLAAFYPACRDCPLRSETGHLPRQTVERLRSTERRAERPSLFTAEGVRGVYLNELDRRTAERIAAASASLLWDDAPLMGRIGSGPVTRRWGPAVVVGHDDRPASPDIVTGVASALRRMGCQVIDIGLSTKPCFWFAADHLQAAAGVFVTGAGCGPSWTGLDFVGRGAVPLSARTGHFAAEHRAGWADLGRIEARLREQCNRPTREAGTHRTFQASIPYEAGLRKHFHGLRPLNVCLATPIRLIRQTLERLFEMLPCRLVPVELPCRSRDAADSLDPDVQTLGELVRSERADFGLLIDDDCQRCAVCDENGSVVRAGQVARLLALEVLREYPAHWVIESRGDDVMVLSPTIANRKSQNANPITLADVSLAMRENQAAFAGGGSGRYWFREAFPTSDGILTLARLLAALSRGDMQFSHVVARSAREDGSPVGS